MDRKEIANQIKDIIITNMPDFADKEINEDTRINTEANFDSMTFVYIMCKIESAFDINIAKRKWEKLQTFGDLISVVEKAINKK